MELELKRYLIPGGDHDGTDPQCSSWGWKVPKHEGCPVSNAILRETGYNGTIPLWPDGKRGTVPSLVKGFCPSCGRKFIGLGPL